MSTTSGTSDHRALHLSDAGERFRLVLEAAPTGVLMIDAQGRIALVNAQVERLFGYSRDELIGSSLEVLVPERFRRQHPAYRQDFFRAPQARAMGIGRDLYGLRKDGSEIPVEIGLTPVSMPEGEFVLSSIVDISERKRSEGLFRLALEASPTGKLMVDPAGRIALVNAQIEAIFGYSREELIGMSVEQLVPERFRHRHAGFRDHFFAAPQARAMGAGRDLYGLRKDGSEVPIEIGLTPVTTAQGDFVLSSILDITERRRAIEQLREHTEALAASLKERDSLLQEVHHRVKNNLQLISSLINIQMRKLEVGAPRDVLGECKRRVETIGLIHEQLYQSRDYGSVPFSQYARHLANNMAHAANTSGSEIVLRYDCDRITLPVEKAISCGLILNELITNAMKHAFPEGRSGELYIILKRMEAGRVRLRVRDSGVGMTENAARAGSIGMQLVSTLAAQLDGKLYTDVDNGTSITVEFPA